MSTVAYPSALSVSKSLTICVGWFPLGGDLPEFSLSGSHLAFLLFVRLHVALLPGSLSLSLLVAFKTPTLFLEKAEDIVRGSVLSPVCLQHSFWVKNTIQPWMKQRAQKRMGENILE